MALTPRVYIRGRGKVTSYGMNIIGSPGCMSAAYPWWPGFVRACEGT
jgi:hypothetical protein